MGVVGRLQRMRYDLTRVLAGRNEEEACFETARSARGFSRRTMAVLDDKLAFSATLMRAGEVDAAYRMMREAEADVALEEIGLFDRVTRVAAAGSSTRVRMTRLRLARLLATAMVSALVMVFSVMSFALAGIIVQRLVPEDGGGLDPANSLGGGGVAEVREVRLAPGLKVSLEPRHARTIQAIMAGKHVPQHDVTEMIAGIPPNVMTDLLARLPTEVADVLRAAMGVPPVSTEVVSIVGQASHKAETAADETKDRAASSEQQSDDAAEEDASEPADADSEASGTKPGKRTTKETNNGGTELNLPEFELP